MENLLLNIDAGTIDWSRAQFALTAIFHWLFVPLTLGMALIMGIAETCYYRTGKVFWKDTAKFWQKLFGINFAPTGRTIPGLSATSSVLPWPSKAL